MGYFTRFSPFRAYRDLRDFLRSREKHQLAFFAAAVAVTSAFVTLFMVSDNDIKPDYHEQIIYVQQWRADRTDAQIIAQQKIDQAAKEKQDAIDKAEKERVRQQFQRASDQLNEIGI